MSAHITITGLVATQPRHIVAREGAIVFICIGRNCPVAFGSFSSKGPSRSRALSGMSPIR